MTSLPMVPFALGMVSVSGSAPFVALVFDDGAAVSLRSLRALAIELGLSIPSGGLFDLLQDWDRVFPALARLVQVVAYDDSARGHRSHFVAEEFLTAEQLVPEARQIIRIRDGRPSALPVTVQGAASSSLRFAESMLSARANFCLGAIMGRMCRHADIPTARGAIAGWTLATEFVRADEKGFERLSTPGSLVLGPLFVPAAFAGDLAGVEYVVALMASPILRGDMGVIAAGVADSISALSRNALLLPGDVVIVGSDPSTTMPDSATADVVETTASGFGRQTISLQ